MQVLIIEDEKPASVRLKKLINELEPQYNIQGVIDSVEQAVKWLRNMDAPNLIFMDVQLADGLSFDIFNHVKVDCPIIFTTAYDQYAIKAFKVNSLDYLLKPFDREELERALNKFKTQQEKTILSIDYHKLMQLVRREKKQQVYKRRFLIKVGDQLKHLPVDEVAYFYSESGAIFLINEEGKSFALDDSLDQLEHQLSSEEFFRINRKLIVNIKSIQKIHAYFNSRLKLELNPPPPFEVIVSRERVSDFKLWLDS